jgi:hypothetical protein
MKSEIQHLWDKAKLIESPKEVEFNIPDKTKQKMAAKIYPKGIMVFTPSEAQQKFKVASVCITLADFKEWINGDGSEYLTEYKDKKQLKLDISKRDDGKLQISVDLYRPEKK